MSISFVPHEIIYEGQNPVYGILINSKFAGELILTQDSGFYVWLPPEDLNGYLPSWVLRSISDKLDELNTEWEKQLSEDLK
jgi:hypothetical protein